SRHDVDPCERSSRHRRITREMCLRETLPRGAEHNPYLRRKRMVNVQLMYFAGLRLGARYKSSDQYSDSPRTPCARSSASRLRSSTRRIFPEIVFGKTANSRRRTRL